MHPEATESKDRYDAMAAPRFLRYSEMVSEHPDFFYPWFSTDVVGTQQHYTWSFTLASNQMRESSQLSWDQNILQGKHSRLFLFDKSAGVLVDMSQQGSYSVDLSKNTFQFNIYYTSAEEPFAPGELMLGNAWPNPATTFVNIPVALPQACKLELSVYDMTGKVIATLAKGEFAAGVYNFTWDRSGEQRSGLFIYRLSLPDSKRTPIQKKLILR
jgi:hypothetical protein